MGKRTGSPIDAQKKRYAAILRARRLKDGGSVHQAGEPAWSKNDLNSFGVKIVSAIYKIWGLNGGSGNAGRIDKILEKQSSLQPHGGAGVAAAAAAARAAAATAARTGT